MYRLLAIDLDGTLLTPRPQKHITPRTRRALQKAREAGLRIVIATGQSLVVLQHICADLPIAGPQIIENGAVIADMQTGQISHEKLLPTRYILPVLQALQQAGFHRAYHTAYPAHVLWQLSPEDRLRGANEAPPSALVSVERASGEAEYRSNHLTPGRVYADIGTPRVRQWYEPPVPPVIEISDTASLYPEPCIKLVGVGVESALRAKRQELVDLFAGQVYVTQSAFDLLEFLHPDVSKAQALQSIARDLDIQPAEVVAIGDGHNDIGMLQFAGLGVAMGNAHEEVKRETNYVTCSNAEEGVALAIEKLILKA